MPSVLSKLFAHNNKEFYSLPSFLLIRHLVRRMPRRAGSRHARLQLAAKARSVFKILYSSRDKQRYFRYKMYREGLLYVVTYFIY